MNLRKSTNYSVGLIDLLFNIFVIIWWLEIGKRIDLLGKIRIELIIGSVLIVFMAVRITQGNINIINPISKAAFAYLGILLFSIPFSVNMSVSWSVYFDRVIKYSLMAFFMMAFIKSTFQLKLFLASTLISFLKIGQEALYGKITGNMVWESQGIPRLHGTQETMFGHPNSLSGKFVALLPFIWFLFSVIDRKWKYLLLILVIFLTNILIFTGSRTGYISTIMAFFFIYLESKKKKKLLIFCIVLFCTAAVFVPQEYHERFTTTFTGEEKEGRSSEARKNLFIDSLIVFNENPLGVGIGAFIEVQKMHGRNPQDTHNLYTQILAETGIQGFIAFVLLIIVILKQNKSRMEKIKIIGENIKKALKNLLIIDSKYFLLEKLNNDSNVLRAICIGTKHFIIIRLILGLFGHDLYEIYWWIAAGTVVALQSCIIDLENRFKRLKGTLQAESRVFST